MAYRDGLRAYRASLNRTHPIDRDVDRRVRRVVVTVAAMILVVAGLSYLSTGEPVWGYVTLVIVCLDAALSLAGLIRLVVRDIQAVRDEEAHRLRHVNPTTADPLAVAETLPRDEWIAGAPNTRPPPWRDMIPAHVPTNNVSTLRQADVGRLRRTCGAGVGRCGSGGSLSVPRRGDRPGSPGPIRVRPAHASRTAEVLVAQSRRRVAAVRVRWPRRRSAWPTTASAARPAARHTRRPDDHRRRRG